MVDDIIKDKDNSRRRMLEQAAGITIYKTRKKEAKNKLTSDVLVKYLTEHTAEEIDTYIKNNITTLNDVKNIVIKLAIAVGVALRE